MIQYYVRWWWWYPHTICSLWCNKTVYEDVSNPTIFVSGWSCQREACFNILWRTAEQCFFLLFVQGLMCERGHGILLGTMFNDEVGTTERVMRLKMSLLLIFPFVTERNSCTFAVPEYFINYDRNMLQTNRKVDALCRAILSVKPSAIRGWVYTVCVATKDSKGDYIHWWLRSGWRCAIQ